MTQRDAHHASILSQPRHENTATGKPHTPYWRKLLRDSLGVAILIAAVYVALSLGTYSPADDPEWVMPINDPVHNRAGAFGAWLASTLFLHLGLAAYGVIALLGLWGAGVTLTGIPRDWSRRLVGSGALLFVVMVFLGDAMPGAPGMPAQGGMIGAVFAMHLGNLSGDLGSAILLSAFLMLGIVLAADKLVVRLITETGHLFVRKPVSQKAPAVESARVPIAETPAPIAAEVGTPTETVPAAVLTEDVAHEVVDTTVTPTTPATASPAETTPIDHPDPPVNLNLGTIPPTAMEMAQTEGWEQASVIVRTGNWLKRLAEKVVRTGGRKARMPEPVPEALPAETSHSSRLAIAFATEEMDDEEEGEAVGDDPLTTDEISSRFCSIPQRQETQRMSVPDADLTELALYAPNEACDVLDDGYELPPVTLLAPPKPQNAGRLHQDAVANARILHQAFADFRINAQVVNIERGPTISQYEVQLAPGTKLNKISNLANELAMVLRAPSVRIVAPIPGKTTIAIEVPNEVTNLVTLRELLTNRNLKPQSLEIPFLLGKDSVGRPMVADLANMPHLLIAGTTGSGKSVAANNLVLSILYLKHPEEVKFVMVDPKMVEFAAFKDIPHLLAPVITDSRETPEAFQFLVNEMERRYQLLERTLCKHLTEYNKLTPAERVSRIAINNDADESLDAEDLPKHLPYIVVLVDELADLMMVAGKEIEESICRLAQKSRAVGIHLVLATQRPSVDVITGLIKANIPCRMSFRVLSSIDSKTILDRQGAEKLLGRGDLLFLPPGQAHLLRAQCAFVGTEETIQVAAHVKQQKTPSYLDLRAAVGPTAKDDLFPQAVQLVIQQGSASPGLLQRELSIPAVRAKQLLILLEAEGIIGPSRGRKPRQVLVAAGDLDDLRLEAA